MEDRSVMDSDELEGMTEEDKVLLHAVWKEEALAVAAEAEKNRAEARKALAEARKAEAEAKSYELEAELTNFEVIKARRTEEDTLACDNLAMTYMFTTNFNEGSVKNCMMQLSKWHRQKPGCKMTIILNSPGGDVIDGMALFDHIIWLRDQGHEIDIVVRGMAASMWGILLQAGTKRILGKEAWVLIHRAAFLAIGKTFQVEDEVKWVKRIEDRIADIFVSRAKEAFDNGTATHPVTRRMIMKNWERKDWWLTSEECLELGIADEVG